MKKRYVLRSFETDPARDEPFVDVSRRRITIIIDEYKTLPGLAPPETYVQRLIRYGVGLIKLAGSLRPVHAVVRAHDATASYVFAAEEPSEVMQAIVALIGTEE